MTRLLLDEHYPVWLAERLRAAGVDAVALVAERPELRSASDVDVLRAAEQEGLAVVTEDVTTFSLAFSAVPHHVGVVFCHHRRFPRTGEGMERLCPALVEVVAAAPETGLGSSPVVIWLAAAKA